MRDTRLQLRGLLAILALTFLGPLPAVADPSDLGITVGEVLQIVDASRDRSVPIEIDQQGGVVEVTLAPSGSPGIRIYAAGKFDNIRLATTKAIWIGFGLGVSRPEDTPESDAVEAASVLAVLNALWQRMTGRENYAAWASRVANGNHRSVGEVRGYSESVNGMRVGLYVGVPTWFVFDTFVDCRLEENLTMARYLDIIAAGLCPDLLG